MRLIDAGSDWRVRDARTEGIIGNGWVDPRVCCHRVMPQHGKRDLLFLRNNEEERNGGFRNNVVII